MVHVPHIVSLEVTQVKTGQSRTAIKHTGHDRHILRIQILKPLYRRQVIEILEPKCGTRYRRTLGKRLVEDNLRNTL